MESTHKPLQLGEPARHLILNLFYAPEGRLLRPDLGVRVGDARDLMEALGEQKYVRYNSLWVELTARGRQLARELKAQVEEEQPPESSLEDSGPPARTIAPEAFVSRAMQTDPPDSPVVVHPESSTPRLTPDVPESNNGHGHSPAQSPPQASAAEPSLAASALSRPASTAIGTLVVQPPRPEIGQTYAARECYGRYGEDAIIWASDQFEERLARFTGVARRTGRDDYDQALLEAGRMPDANAFRRTLRFFRRKPSHGEMYLVLCAAESYGFLRQLPAPDRPHHPLPFLLHDEGTREAGRIRADRRARKWRMVRSVMAMILSLVAIAIGVVVLLNRYGWIHLRR